MARPLVIVESPAKAKTIRGFLGGNYLVEASIGHIRDLPRSAAEIPESVRKESWARLGVNVDDDFTPVYVVPGEKKEQVAKLRALVKDASELLLATDEDREGESISWHLLQVLKPKVPVKRLVFHEITPEAIKEALAHARDVDEDLVRAQETRRIVDRLYGYEVSPLLWKKVRPKLSAGRVQSVAVRLIVDRERARMAFKSSGWWDLLANFDGSKGGLEAGLAEVGGRRIATGKDFDETTGALKAKDVLLLDEARATALAKGCEGKKGVVSKVEQKPYRDRPAPPFTTSTLQQEANRKLRWTAKHTMKVAQGLYENGWITYMRTDSLTLSDQAINAARGFIASMYGADHLPPQPRRYKSTAKNAQEAHEAIRPAGARFRSLDEARRELDTDAARLYELIWKRTVACQMADAEGFLLSVAVDMPNDPACQAARFVANGKTITFPGFRRAYVEGSDDPDAELSDQERLLPPLAVGDTLVAKTVAARGHTTQPPARLTEATLVKELEARGIGRPSTYADIIGKIIERDYVFKRGNALVPTFTAFAVTNLMERHLGELVDYAFTARIEDNLDEIALGKRPWVQALRDFYLGRAGLRERLGEAEKTVDPREVCTVPIGRDGDTEVVVRIGRFGPFLSAGDRTADVPEDTSPEDATVAWALARLDGKAQGPTVLGKGPEGKDVLLLDGRFGPFVQLGVVEDVPKPKGKKKGAEPDKPKRASLLKGMKPQDVTLELALALLSLPRTVGAGENGEPIVASNGKFGPYIRCGKDTRTVPPSLSVLTLTEADARGLLAAAPQRAARSRIEALRELGPDPVTKATIKLMQGRFGPYVTDGETNATVPKGIAPENLTPEEAAELLQKRREAGPPVKKGGRFRKGAAKAAARPAAEGAEETTTDVRKRGTKKAAGDAPVRAARLTRGAKAEDGEAGAAKAAPKRSTKSAGTKAAGTKAAGPKAGATAGTKAAAPKAEAPKAAGTKAAGAKKGAKKPAEPPPKPVIPKMQTVKYGAPARPAEPTTKPVVTRDPASRR